ncbi:hypothetical protein Tco_0588718 [Tanacetum coccineum]
MLNTNNNLQTQTSNALHNAIMEAGGKDRPPMLAPGNYVQWKSRIKRYIDTKPNNELIHHCLQNPPYKFKWTEKIVPVKAIERLKQGESINVQDLETNLYWEFGKFTSRDVNVQFLLQLQPEWQRFVTLVKQSQELKIVSYHKLYDILKQHQAEVNEIRVERLARTANLLALVAQQQPAYHPQNHPNHHTPNSSTRSQQATRNRGKAIINSIAPIYDQEPATKIYKPTNNNIRTSSNTSRANQDNSPRINRGTGYENQRVVNVVGARDNVGTQQADWKDDTDDESDDQELEAHYMYMEHIQEVTPDAADNFGPIFNDEPLQKVQNNDDNYNVFSIKNKHPELPESVNDTYLEKHDDTNITIDSLDIKNHNKFLETSNKALVDKLKGEIEDFKTKNKSLESSNNHFKEANNELSKTNPLMFKDLKKFQAELDRYHDVNYASKVAIDCAKAKGDLMSYKIESEKSSNEYTRKINDLNQIISDMKKELFAHQETISIMSHKKEAQIKFYKTREDKKLDKVIALENKVKVMDAIVYKIGQSV